MWTSARNACAGAVAEPLQALRRPLLYLAFVLVAAYCLTRVAAPAALLGEEATRYRAREGTSARYEVTKLQYRSFIQLFYSHAPKVAGQRSLASFSSVEWRPGAHGEDVTHGTAQQQVSNAEEHSGKPRLRVDPKWNASPISRIPLQPGYTCEPPYSDNVRVHVLVTLLTRQTYLQLKYLGMIGLSNADVFAYHRQDTGIQTEARVELPCGMRFHEKLLVPNVGEEGATFVTHVAHHYDDLPDIIITLHGGSLQSWHSSCGVAIRRMRAVYRGLSPSASLAMRTFSSDVVTLNSLTHDGPWIADDCCGPLFAKWSFQGNNSACPWEYVGDAATLWEGKHKQVLCRLRDEASGAEWTLLSTDVPEFFIHPNETLQKYRDNPQLLARADTPAVGPRRKLSHTPSESPSPRPASRVTRRSRGERQTSARATAPRRRLLDAYMPAELLDDADDGAEEVAAGGVDGAKIERVRDSVFPQHREKDLVTPPRVFENHPVYGLERFWNWILQVHGMYGNYTRDGRPGESAAKWCCFQGIVPRNVIQSVSKSWWLDAAFLATHLAWKPQKEWPKQIGFLLEWRIWPSLNRRYITRERMQAYVDVEVEMGADGVVSRCAQELAVPLEADGQDANPGG